jgi:di/tricarboxylate transporter
MSHLRSFGLFWWNFVVGDDWRVAAGLAVALALTWLLERADVTAWWLLPVAVGLLLAESLRREVRSSEERRDS